MVQVECATGAEWTDASVGEECKARAVWDNHVKMQQDATNGIIITLFIGILLFLSFMMYSQDVQSLVVRPIEVCHRALRFVASTRPVAAAREEDEDEQDLNELMVYSRYA